MRDPDKKVDEFNKKMRNLYKNYIRPKAYANEGSEFDTIHPNKKDKGDKERQ